MNANMLFWRGGQTDYTYRLRSEILHLDVCTDQNSDVSQGTKAMQVQKRTGAR